MICSDNGFTTAMVDTERCSVYQSRIIAVIKSEHAATAFHKLQNDMQTIHEKEFLCRRTKIDKK